MYIHPSCWLVHFRQVRTNYTENLVSLATDWNWRNAFCTLGDMRESAWCCSKSVCSNTFGEHFGNGAEINKIQWFHEIVQMAAMGKSWTSSGTDIHTVTLNTVSNNSRHAVVQIWPGCWGLTHMPHKIIRSLWLNNQHLNIHTAEVSLSNTLNDHQLRGCRPLWPSCSKTTREQQSPSDRSKNEWKSARMACKWTKRRMRGSIIDQMSMLTKQHGSASLVFLLVAFTDNWITATSVT